MRILLVSQMYPGPRDPDLGIFVQGLADALERRGHELERAVLTERGGGRRRYLRLGGAAAASGKRFRPDVVWAHFLVPTSLLAGLASRAPLVATGHGQDIANIGSVRGVRRATRIVARRAAALVTVSDFLRRELEQQIPEARGKTHVVDCGVDLAQFRGGDASEARRELGWDGDGPAFLCVGSLIERKNVVRLARAFADVGYGRLAFVGDGPLRSELEAIHHERIRLVGRVPHGEVARWIQACDVLAQPSLVEPFGQALLEAMASERSVVATEVGGPPEFVTPGAGILVDPLDEAALARALESAASLPTPNRAAREAAAAHDVNAQAERLEVILEEAARGRAA